MIVADALQRVDTILDAEQLPEAVNGKKPSVLQLNSEMFLIVMMVKRMRLKIYH